MSLHPSSKQKEQEKKHIRRASHHFDNRSPQERLRNRFRRRVSETTVSEATQRLPDVPEAGEDLTARNLARFSSIMHSPSLFPACRATLVSEANEPFFFIAPDGSEDASPGSPVPK